MWRNDSPIGPFSRLLAIGVDFNMIDIDRWRRTVHRDVNSFPAPVGGPFTNSRAHSMPA
jgi:hypothetical protein